MTDRERLIEEYENAYFAVLMYDLAEHEGRQLIRENNRLKNDPTFAVPESVQQRALTTIRRAFRKGKAQTAIKHAKWFINKAAVVFLIVSVLFTTTYAAVPEFRASTLNLLIKTSNISTSITMTPDASAQQHHSSTDIGSLLGYRVPQVPDGYYLHSAETEDDFLASLYYLTPGNDYISICVTYGNGTSHNVDTENADTIEEITINGVWGLLVKKNGEKCATLADTDNGYFISIYSSNTDDKELLRMLNEMERISE